MILRASHPEVAYCCNTFLTIIMNNQRHDHYRIHLGQAAMVSDQANMVFYQGVDLAMCMCYSCKSQQVCEHLCRCGVDCACAVLTRVKAPNGGIESNLLFWELSSSLKVPRLDLGNYGTGKVLLTFLQLFKCSPSGIDWCGPSFSLRSVFCSIVATYWLLICSWLRA